MPLYCPIHLRFYNIYLQWRSKETYFLSENFVALILMFPVKYSNSVWAIIMSISFYDYQCVTFFPAVSVVSIIIFFLILFAYIIYKHHTSVSFFLHFCIKTFVMTLIRTVSVRQFIWGVRTRVHWERRKIILELFWRPHLIWSSEELKINVTYVFQIGFHVYGDYQHAKICGT